MPTWLYSLPMFAIAVVMVGGIIAVSLIGLVLARRFVRPHFHYHDGINEAISGTMHAIGVFYGVTVGLIAVGVWTNYTNAHDIASREATAVASLYSDIMKSPEPTSHELEIELPDYLVTVIQKVWPALRRGTIVNDDAQILHKVRTTLMAFEPHTEGEKVRYTEALAAFGRLVELRRLRIDAAGNSLSPVMWWVIWIGAAISISVGYLYKIDDGKLHATLIVLMAGFLGIVLFMIAINDKPFFGTASIGPASYELVLDAAKIKPAAK